MSRGSTLHLGIKPHANAEGPPKRPCAAWRLYKMLYDWSGNNPRTKTSSTGAWTQPVLQQGGCGTTGRAPPTLAGPCITCRALGLPEPPLFTSAAWELERRDGPSVHRREVEGAVYSTWSCVRYYWLEDQTAAKICAFYSFAGLMKF